MPVSTQQYRQLLKRQENFERAITERLDDIGARQGSTEDIASQHGQEHNDLGRDPILGADLSGHTHAFSSTATIMNTESGFQNTVSGTTTIPYPPGIEDGDLLMMFYYSVNSSTAPTWTTTDADWTELFTIGGNTYGVYKFCDGTETGTFDITSNGPTTHITYVIYRIANALTGVAPYFATADNTGADPPPLSPFGDTRSFLWMTSCGHDSASLDITAAPSGYEDYVEESSASNGELATAHRTITTVTEDPGAFTTTGSGAFNVSTVAVAPSVTVKFGMTTAEHMAIGQLAPHNTAWDAILDPGTDIQTTWDGGAKVLLLLDGTHNVTGNLTPPAGAVLWGQSLLNTTIEFGDADRRFIMSNAAVLIGNMTVDGSTTTSGVFDCNSTLHKLERLRIQDCTTGINNANELLAVDILLQSPKGTDDWIVASGGTTTLIKILTTASTNTPLQVSSGTVFITSSNLFGGNAVNVVELSGTGGRMFMSGSVLTAGSGGGVCLDVQNTGQAFVSSCRFSNASDDGSNNIRLSGNTGVSVIANSTIRRGLVGVDIQNDNNRIVSCEITDCVDGIVTGSGNDRNILSANYIHTNSQYGIDIQSGSVNTVVHGNVVINNSTGQINDNGTNTRKGLNVTV